jgi:adenosylhomocysteine nucleosidase
MALKILVITALSWEAAQVARHLRGVRTSREGGFVTWHGDHRGVDVVVLRTGMGPECAARALRYGARTLRPDAVLSTGCAGALVPGLAAGDVVVADDIVVQRNTRSSTALVWRDRYAAAAAAAGLRAQRGAMLSTPAIASGTDEKRQLAALGVLAVEMEAGAVAAWAAEIGVPFGAARVILDSLDMPIAPDVAAVTRSDGSVAAGRVIAAIVRRPSIVRDLAAMGVAARRCAGALKALHRELFRAL